MPKPTLTQQLAAAQAELEVLRAQVSDLQARVEVTPTVVVSATPRNGKFQPRPDVFYRLHGIPQRGQIQPQGVICARILSTASDSASISESEAFDLINNNVAALHTRQEAWRIFQYYRPRLIELGFLTVHDGRVAQ